MFARRITGIGLCLLAVACKRGIPDEEVAAKVNGEPITKVEFQAQVDRNMARYRGTNHQLPPSIEVRIKESVLRRMIDDKMVAQKAKKLGADVTDQELEEKFQEYKGRFRTDQAFQDYLKRSKNTEANMRADLRRNMLRDRVVEQLSGEIAVEEAEVAAYYDENKQRFVEREQIKASRILLRVAPNTSDADKKATRTKARKLRAEAVGGSDFAALAKEASTGPQAGRGGDLGWFARGRFPPEFDNVAFSLESGAVSDVIETKMGYEIVKVWDRRAERQRPLEEVKENIKNSLMARKRNEKRRKILQELKGTAEIETLIAFDSPRPPRPTRPKAKLGKAIPAEVSPPPASPDDKPHGRPAAQGGHEH
jgi:parvulin-like peptidyl-prolyl isomerase